MALRIASKIVGYEVESKAAEAAESHTKPAEQSVKALPPEKPSAAPAANSSSHFMRTTARWPYPHRRPM